MDIPEDLLKPPSDYKQDEVSRLIENIEVVQGLINQPCSKEVKAQFLQLLKAFEGQIPPIGDPVLSRRVEVSIKRATGLILSHLGRFEMEMGNLDSSLEYNNKALNVGREIQDVEISCVAAENLGITFMEMDKYCQALNLLHECLDMMDKFKSPMGKKYSILYNLAVLYRKVGDRDKALDFAKQALAMAREGHDNAGIGLCLTEVGINLLAAGNDTEAEEYLFGALTCFKATGNKSSEGNVLSHIALVHAKRGNYESAFDLMLKALKIFRERGDKGREATALINLAYLYRGQQDIGAAQDCAEKALGLARETASLKDDADACYILGTIHDHHNNNFDQAYRYYKESIDTLERIRKDLMLDDLKISFGEISDACYEQMVSLCIRLNRIDEAFQYVERSRSRALIDLLSRTAEKIAPHIISEEKATELKDLRERLAWLRKRLRHLYTKMDPEVIEKREVRFDDEVARAVYEEIMQVEGDYRETYEDIKRLDPEWASLSGVEPLKMDDLKQMLDENTKILEYYQTANRLFIFVVSSNGETMAFQTEADETVMKERLSQLLSKVRGDTFLSPISHQYVRDIKLPLSEFYNRLILPVEEVLEGVRHLIIIPHLLWHHLPFHALYDKQRKSFLIDRFEIAYAPSAGILNYCRMKNRFGQRSAAIFANPTGDLPYAEAEAEKVAECFVDVQLLKGHEATLQKLFEVQDADILHLACHCQFRDDEPVLSHLLLADSEEGRGTCFLPDLFNLKLKSSLVTMSACESGLSRPYSGDDLVGFTRGLFYAGVPSVMVTLWHVNDQSTAILMKAFYQNFIKERLSKSRSLQLAIRQLKSTEAYQHPLFWAPFILMGDGR